MALRNVRRDAMKSYDKLEKGGSLGEDQIAALKKSMDAFDGADAEKVEEATKAKETELQQV